MPNEVPARACHPYPLTNVDVKPPLSLPCASDSESATAHLRVTRDPQSAGELACNAGALDQPTPPFMPSAPVADHLAAAQVRPTSLELSSEAHRSMTVVAGMIGLMVEQRSSDARSSFETHTVGSRRLISSPVLTSYWKLARERQRVYFSRLTGNPAPWTNDPVVGRYRFTNAYRAADRVSQDLLRVQYSGTQDGRDLVFRTLLFRFFNKPSTWDLLERGLGPLVFDEFAVGRYAVLLNEALARGQRLYSAAYILPPPHLGAARKHENHLRLIQYMMDDGFADKLYQAQTLEAVYMLIRSYPSLGPFLSFQLTIDLNYSSTMSFDEDDFVVAGPGARSGIRKCFLSTGGLSDEDIIRWMVDTQESQCADLGLDFDNLFGRRLKLIDCQNLFCETDKYARVAHPEVAGIGSRTRIKQEFIAAGPLRRPFFPPKWNLTEAIAEFCRHDRHLTFDDLATNRRQQEWANSGVLF